MCKYFYEYEGYRSDGVYVPRYAQGAYYPGDEPGPRCKLVEYCSLENCPYGEDYCREHGEPEELY